MGLFLPELLPVIWRGIEINTHNLFPGQLNSDGNDANDDDMRKEVCVMSKLNQKKINNFSLGVIKWAFSVPTF